MPKVLVTSDHSMGSTTVGVNGVYVKVPHNKEVPISDAHLEALQNAHQPRVTVKVLDDKVETSAEAEVVTAGTQLAGQAPESGQDPATPAAESDGTRAAEQAAKNPAEEKPDPTTEPPELTQAPVPVVPATTEQSSKDSSKTVAKTAAAPKPVTVRKAATKKASVKADK